MSGELVSLCLMICRIYYFMDFRDVWRLSILMGGGLIYLEK